MASETERRVASRVEGSVFGSIHAKFTAILHVFTFSFAETFSNEGRAERMGAESGALTRQRDAILAIPTCR